jgi:hypothetical protein
MPGVFSSEEFENALEDMISGEIEKKTFVWDALAKKFLLVLN